MVEENTKEENKEEAREEKQEEETEEVKPASPETTEDKAEDKKIVEVKKEEKTEERKEIKEELKKEKKEESEEKEVEVPKKFKELVEKIEKMSVMDLAELVKILEKKFGVTATPQVVAASISAGAESPAEEKTEFNIELKEIGSQKIQVIKAVRDITEKGLKESKDLVDAAASSPQIVKENVKKEEAEEIKKKFEEAGAKVELK